MTARQYLLDTNVLSETRRHRPHERVLAFLAEAEPTSLFVSVLTLGELRKGVAARRKSDPELAHRLAAWVDGLESSYTDRLLGVDAAIARLWGEWSAERPRTVVDTLLAATAAVHDLILVTRNTGDVAGLPVQVLNPWSFD